MAPARLAAPARWLRRYGPAELLALVGALAGYLLLDLATGNHAAAAYGAALGDFAAYYGFLFAREVRTQAKLARRPSGRIRVVARSLRALTCEFGPAEVLDSMIVRPTCTSIAVAAVGPAAGVVLAKLAADLAFYVPVICTYELRRRRRDERRALTAGASEGSAT
jgi:hypothetical protein